MEAWQEEIQNSYSISNSKSFYPNYIPPQFLKKIQDAGESSPLWKQFMPSELENSNEGFVNPIGDKDFNKGQRIIHRYKNRVLFTPTTHCPILCRYCFRKNELAFEKELYAGDFKKTLLYLEGNLEIEEIIFTGGDPLVLSDKKIDYYLNEFSKIAHIKYVRFHTRTPVIIPSRITESFVNTLNKYQSRFNFLGIIIHTNHITEWSDEFYIAVKLLKRSRIELLAQSVLLKDVNNSLSDLVNLFKGLIDVGIRPYYLHHPDQAKGAMHFYLSLREGRNLYRQLPDYLPGWAIPQYIVDTSNGQGKVPAYNPENLDYSGQFIRRDGLIIKHTEPDQFFH